MVQKRKKRPFLKKNSYELQAWAQERLVCGIDEVGRGCLAGPVVTAAVILPPNCSYRLLKDSKEMSEEERLLAYKWIKRNCWYGVGIVHHRAVDTHNVWHATLIAMRKAVMHLLAVSPHRPSCFVVDAMPLKLHGHAYADIPVHHFPFGEKKSSSIAAASILAKVRRDAMMSHMHDQFPHFAWHTNKGYGTKEHKSALKDHTKTILHRVSYLENLTLEQKEDTDGDHQQRIC